MLFFFLKCAFSVKYSDLLSVYGNTTPYLAYSLILVKTLQVTVFTTYSLVVKVNVLRNVILRVFFALLHLKAPPNMTLNEFTWTICM